MRAHRRVCCWLSQPHRLARASLCASAERERPLALPLLRRSAASLPRGGQAAPAALLPGRGCPFSPWRRWAMDTPSPWGALPAAALSAQNHSTTSSTVTIFVRVHNITIPTIAARLPRARALALRREELLWRTLFLRYESAERLQNHWLLPHGSAFDVRWTSEVEIYQIW